MTATLEQVDLVHRLVAPHPDDLVLSRTADEVTRVLGTGRIASLRGMEGGHSVNGSLGTLRMMHRLGVRYMTLTHNENVPWADSATDEPVLGGLSDFGRDAVRETLAVAAAPVIFSHSSAHAVCRHPRNVPDDVLTSRTSNGGVCMATFVPMFVSQDWAEWYFECLDVAGDRGLDPRRFEDLDPVLSERAGLAPPPPTVSDVADHVDHVDHVREVAGIGHLGIGGDYDGAGFFPAGLEDVSGYPRLFDELRGRGYSEDDPDRIGSGNTLRAMRDMEAVASR